MTTELCPAIEDLRRLLNGELREADAVPLERHLLSCMRCGERVEVIEADGPWGKSAHPQAYQRSWPDPVQVGHLVERLEQMPVGTWWKNSGNAPQPPTRSLQEPPAGSTLDSANPPSPAAPAGLVPGYQILEVLGRGGMGIVYKARQFSLKRLVALKMILAGSQAEPPEVARFLKEAEIIAQLKHPNVVEIYDLGTFEDRPFFSLELLEGGSLSARLKAEPQPPREAAQLIETLARAIQAAHDRGIVHRDLKPANVLLTADGTPKITDFGLARWGTSEITATGTVMGTPSYMAPEQTEGRSQQIGPATDVWALGVILYQLLTGRQPFTGDSHLATMRRICSEEPEPLRQLCPTVPQALEAVVQRCLRKRPEERYPSAAALADDLQRFLDGQITLPLPAILKLAARRRPVVWLAVAASAALVAVGVTLALLRSRDPSPAPAGPAAVLPVQQPLQADLSVQVWTKGPGKRGLKVEEQGSGALPVRNGERVQLTAKLNRLAFLYLIWLDAEGDATGLYPWNDNEAGDLDNDLTMTPPDRPMRQQVRSPRREGSGFPVDGKSGLVTALLLGREQPLPATVKLGDLLASLKGQLKNDGQPLAQELVVRGFDRGQVNEAVKLDRSRGLKKAGDIDDAVLHLRDRLREHFEVIRTVSFAQVGDQ